MLRRINAAASSGGWWRRYQTATARWARCVQRSYGQRHCSNCDTSSATSASPRNGSSRLGGRVGSGIGGSGRRGGREVQTRLLLVGFGRQADDDRQQQRRQQTPYQ